MTSQAAIVYRITSASTVVSRACFCKQQRWVLDSNRRVGVWSFPWRWHIRSILSMTGRGISAETCGLDDVFPPDDLCSRPGAQSHYIFIYTYAFFIRVLVIGCIYTYTGSVILYWWSCTPSQSIGLVFWGACSSSLECHLLFSLVSTICVLLYGNKINTRMLVTIGICFKLYFDTRHFAFCNLSPSRMFLSLDLLPEYRIQHTIGLLYATFIYSTRIFYRGVSGFATDCPCGVWCRGLTTCLLYVGPLFGYLLLNNSWAVGLTCWIVNSRYFFVFWHT